MYQLTKERFISIYNHLPFEQQLEVLMWIYVLSDDPDSRDILLLQLKVLIADYIARKKD